MIKYQKRKGAAVHEGKRSSDIYEKCRSVCANGRLQDHTGNARAMRPGAQRESDDGGLPEANAEIC